MLILKWRIILENDKGAVCGGQGMCVCHNLPSCCLKEKFVTHSLTALNDSKVKSVCLCPSLGLKQKALSIY